MSDYVDDKKGMVMLMYTLDWKNINEEELKSSIELVKAFKKWLKKSRGYSAEEAKFCCDIIEDPYSKYANVDKEYERNVIINDIEYEVYYCTTDENGSLYKFEFYMLVDKATIGPTDRDDSNFKFSYYIAKKKFILF